MKITRVQKDAFEARASELFPRRVQELLCEHLPERRAELEGPRGLSRINASIGKARERGYAGERDAAKFVALGVVLGDGFEAQPWAAEILDDARYETPTDRIEALWAAAKQRELDDAAHTTAAALS
jgi:hypothetical protein